MGSIFHGLIQFQSYKTVQFVQRGKSNTTCYLFIKVPDTQKDQPQQIVRTCSIRYLRESVVHEGCRQR
jgi:hypothetical protein